MARNFTNDGIYIAKVMRDHLNSWPKKPAVFALEDFGKKCPSLMLQQLSAAEKIRSYIDGSYIGVWNFAVYIRVDGNDTAARLDAVGCLNELGEWLEQKDASGSFMNLPDIDVYRTTTKVEMSTTPSIAARYEDGTEDYQAVFQLQYKSRRK